MNKYFSVLLLITFTSVMAISQNDGDELRCGEYKILHSDILNADRTLLVHLPEGYESSKKNYPVVVKLFGTHPAYYLQMTSAMELMASQGQIPEFIFVGVDQHSHGEVIPPEVPSNQYPHQGDKFLEFVDNELLPFIDSNYRTDAFRVLMGSYDCGIFGIYTLFSRPGLFNAYLVNNPGRYGGSSDFLAMIEEKKKSVDLDKRYLFISYMEDNYKPMVETTKKFIHYLESDLPEGLRFEHAETIREAGDELKAYYYCREPFLSLFEGYSCPADVCAQGYEAIEGYYSVLSDRLGYTLDIPYRTLDNTANTLWQQGKINEAEKIFILMTQQQPERIDAYFRLGDLYSSKEDYERSIEYYQKCLDMNPNITVAKIRMKQAREKMK